MTDLNLIISQGYIDANYIITQGFTIGTAPTPSTISYQGLLQGRRTKRKPKTPPQTIKILTLLKQFLELKQNA